MHPNNHITKPRDIVGSLYAAAGGNGVSYVAFYFIIKVYTKKGGTGELIEFLKWSNLRFELRNKYDWYFKYRAALLQVKYPCYVVECYWGNEPATGKTLDQIRKDRIRSKKAKITEFKNKLEKARKEWSSMFPIEDDEFYQKAVSKIKKLEYELTLL